MVCFTIDIYAFYMNIKVCGPKNGGKRSGKILDMLIWLLMLFSIMSWKEEQNGTNFEPEEKKENRLKLY